MKFAVFGTGGVGGYFGGRLAEAGHDVTFIARGQHLAAMKANGLSIDSVAGATHIVPVKATDRLDAVGVVDVVLVCTKAWQVAEIAPQIRPLLGDQTIVVPLQNGVEAPSALAPHVGASRVLGGLCKIIAYIDGPGRIKHIAASPEIIFGELDGARSARVAQLKAVLDGCHGVTASVPDDIRVAMWEKFMLIVAHSGVGAVTRQPLGVMLAIPEVVELLRQAMREVVAVAQAQAIDLSPSIVAKTMQFFAALSPDTTASMQRDILAGRPSELENQTGTIVRLGRQFGVPTPVNSVLYAALKPQEMAARGTLG